MVISIHALREESDVQMASRSDRWRSISIHALREESDLLRLRLDRLTLNFQSTLSVRRATGWPVVPCQVGAISIHALREESDASASALPLFTAIFQSTLSVRRATVRRRDDAGHPMISIHALREESDRKFCSTLHLLTDFNPRSP